MKFYKYQGTGNDFILTDDRDHNVSLSQQEIAKLCHRRFGIGADGFMFLRNHKDYDFEMVYYNSDGNQSSMCGNGGRCIVQFAHDLGIIKNKGSFLAVDGPHKALVTNDSVSLLMADVNDIDNLDGAWFVDTGSPHYVKFSSNPQNLDFINQAKAIRNSKAFAKDGVNVNFVEITEKGLNMRTYERGVEDETYSCGTGVTAAALVAFHSGKVDESKVSVFTKGGNLKVRFVKQESGFKDIWLTGSAEFVFKGEIEI